MTSSWGRITRHSDAQCERAENAAQPASVLLLHLLEDVDGRVGVATQGSISNPRAQRLGGVLVRPFGPAVVLAGKDEPNDVVRICGLEGARLGFLDDVVGGDVTAARLDTRAGSYRSARNGDTTRPLPFSSPRAVVEAAAARRASYVRSMRGGRRAEMA